MCIREQAIDDVVVWRLYGRLTGDATALLDRALSRAALHGWRRIVMDLSGVSMIDAGGLGSLVAVHRATGASLLALSLARVPSRVRHVLMITQLTSLLVIFDSVEQALPNTCSTACSATSLPASPRLREPADSRTARKSVTQGRTIVPRERSDDAWTGASE